MRKLSLAGTSVLALGVGLATAQSIDTTIDNIPTFSALLADYGDSIATQQLEIGDVTVTINNQALLPDPLLFIITGTVSSDALQDVSNNSADATAIGNSADSNIDDESLLGSNGAGIGNAQANLGNSILAEIHSVGVGGFVSIDGGDPFTDTFTVRGNSLDSAAIGSQNLATIKYDNVSVEGDVTDPGSTLIIDDATPGMTGDLGALLGIMSAQGNIGVTIDGTLHTIILGIVFDEDVAGGTLVVGDNGLTASSTGNIGNQAIEVQTAANFDASAAIGNQQANYESDISTAIGTAVGDPIMVGIQVGAVNTGATLVTADNTVQGLATGNQAASGIVVDATDLQADTGLSSAKADFDNMTLEVLGGLSVANVQVNYATPITTDVAGILMGVTTGDAIADSTVVVAGNSIQSGARGNVAGNSIALSGVSGGGLTVDAGTLNAAIGSGQYTGDEVAATLSESQIGISSSGVAVTDSTLVIAGNRMQSSAIANSVTNSLSVALEAAQIGDGGIASSLSAIADYNTTNGVFSLTNGQWYEGDVSASNDASEIGTLGVTDIDGSVFVLNRNAIGSLARGNVALGEDDAYGNSIRIDVVALDTTTTDEGENIAALLNIQEAGADVTAETTGARIGTTNNNLGVDGSTATVAGNLIYAIAEGSIAENQISFSGTDYVGGYPGATAVETQTGEVSREFSLLNVQGELDDATGRVVVATVSDFSIDLDVTSLDESVAVVTGNTVQALARDNNAVNVLELGADGSFANLVATGAVVNEQVTSAEVTATITNGAGSGLVNIDVTGDADDSTLVISDNVLDARAEGNRSVNAISVAAADLGGSVTSTSAGAEYTAPTTATASALADYAVLNSQSNTGNITASVSGTLFTGANVDGGMNNALTTVSGNQVRATGVANAALNQVAMASAASASVSGAIASSQFNSGDVTASVTGMVMGITAGGAATGSINVVRGNSITATAVGNSVTNRISRSGY